MKPLWVPYHPLFNKLFWNQRSILVYTFWSKSPGLPIELFRDVTDHGLFLGMCAAQGETVTENMLRRSLSKVQTK